MVTHPCLRGHNYLALFLPRCFQFYFINKKTPNAPPKQGFDFGYELVGGSELKLFMVMCPVSQKRKLGWEAQPRQTDVAPFWKKLHPKPQCSTAKPRAFANSSDEAALDYEKYELGNGQKILLNRKKKYLWGTCNVCFRKRCLATTKQTISLTKSTGWNLSVKF